jgi:HK97 family phage major capsid protein
MARTREELKTARAELATKIQADAKAFNDAGKKFKDAEAQANWDKLNKDYDAVMAELAELDQADSVGARLSQLERDATAPRNPLNIGLDDAGNGQVGGRRAPGNEVAALDATVARELAFNGWCRAQMSLPVTREQARACRQVRLNPHARALNIRLPNTDELNRLRDAFLDHRDKNGARRRFEYASSLSSQTGSSGGYTVVPETLLQRLEINMLAFGGMRQVADQIVTATGEDLGWPTADDTSNEGRILAEGAAADDNAGAGTSGDAGPNPSFGKTVFGAHKFTSDTIKVPYELLEDSSVNLASIIGDMLGERLGRITNRKYTVGTAAGEPQGVVTGATLGVTTASATAIAFGEIIDLEHSVDVAYRSGAQYMLHDLVLSYIRQIVGSDGHPIYQSNFATGAPDTINGRPYVINNHLDSAVTATKTTIVFGQLSKYKIRRVGGIRLYRMTERYREQDSDGFCAFLREDGGVLSAGTAPIKYLQQKA